MWLSTVMTNKKSVVVLSKITDGNTQALCVKLCYVALATKVHPIIMKIKKIRAILYEKRLIAT